MICPPVEQDISQIQRHSPNFSHDNEELESERGNGERLYGERIEREGLMNREGGKQIG
jgi:hypothetical protein